MSGHGAASPGQGAFRDGCGAFACRCLGQPSHGSRRLSLSGAGRKKKRRWAGALPSSSYADCLLCCPLVASIEVIKGEVELLRFQVLDDDPNPVKFRVRLWMGDEVPSCRGRGSRSSTTVVSRRHRAVVARVGEMGRGWWGMIGVEEVRGGERGNKGINCCLWWDLFSG